MKALQSLEMSGQQAARAHKTWIFGKTDVKKFQISQNDIVSVTKEWITLVQAESFRAHSKNSKNIQHIPSKVIEVSY